ncbi:MAG: LacI family DNA-binding transcriptional regulator [Lachnospiraceae bacterium]|nr:LacI family DNA-binding transcriptional regulator [Lachnospiraceae bacterium]
MNREKNITISDVAEALGVSKTTVSRSISGKGRISEETRNRVFAYIQEHHYKPNVIAKGLAQSKTFNLCVAMPGDYALGELPFFQEALIGIQQEAGAAEYDVLLCVCQEDDISALERIVENQKVDGVILLRTFVEDAQAAFLARQGVPFVTAGTLEDETVFQVDHDHERACRELVTYLLSKERGGDLPLVFLGGRESIVVNRKRIDGIRGAYGALGIPFPEERLYRGLVSDGEIERIVRRSLQEGVGGIVCLDDRICTLVLRLLRQLSVAVPEQVMVASCYDSAILENNSPAVTAISFPARELGAVCCRQLLKRIEKESAGRRILLPHKLLLRESTKDGPA